jgi:transcriptional regulator with XRE-family HTH domain
MGGRGSGRRPDLERRRQAAALRSRGWTLARIGQRLGRSREGVRLLLRDAGSDAMLPPLLCSACRAVAAPRPRGGRLAGPFYCRACLMKDPDIPLGARIRSLRLAAGLSQPALAERAGITSATLRLLECHECNPSWPVLSGLLRVLGTALVGGGHVRYPRSRGTGGGAVYCRECRECLGSGPAGFTSNAPAYCLTCLARHPDATFGERLKAYRLSAGLTQRELSERAEVCISRVTEFESGRSFPQWRTLRKLMGMLGVGLVDVAGG